MSLQDLLVKIGRDRLSDGEQLELSLLAGQLDHVAAFASGWNDGLNGIKSSAISFPFAPIYDTVLESDLSSVSVGIPDLYNHLLIVASGRTDAAGQSYDFMDLQLGGDTGANYHWSYIQQLGTTVTANETLGDTKIRFGDFSGATANADSMSGCFLFMPHVRAPLWKPVYSLAGAELVAAGSGRVTVRSGFWKSTAPIDNVKIFPETGTVIKAGSLISVYGIL